ncbi:GTP cyclohydrolase FolE2 [Spirochaetota bacterium]|nr:GTP cyclohydrolase FolE2 [Spirochaetota bacterium]
MNNSFTQKIDPSHPAQTTRPDNITPRSKPLPDITTNSQANLNYTIDQVGMSAMQMIARVNTKDNQTLNLPAKVDVYVNLNDTHSKGIHMSRLYAVMYQFLKNETLNPALLENVTDQLIQSQKGISSSAYVTIKFDYPIEHQSLLSQTPGLRHYPITIYLEKHQNKSFLFKLGWTLTYSSACPCSTALSEQFIKDNLNQTLVTNPQQPLTLDFLTKQNIISAIPHSQRSYADILLSFDTIPKDFSLEEFILSSEAIIKTGVQTSVKRSDEQEFARINAENLMFCEDAVRILKDFYLKQTMIKHFSIKVSHHESLHPHNAVAIVSQQT